jgi:RNA-directed DNA polymerase
MVSDKRLLTLIRAFLRAGVMEGGLVSPVDEGTPQGGPLSPLLSNLVLDDLDKELTRRGHRFCRYADDCNIYVRSHRAGECSAAIWVRGQRQSGWRSAVAAAT